MTVRLRGADVLPPMEEPKKRPTSAAPVAKAPKPDTKALQKGRDRWSTLNTFIDTTARQLPAIDALVWLVFFRDARNDLAAVSQGYVADRLGVCRETVSRAIKRLINAGLVTIARPGGFRRGTNVYRLREIPKAEVTAGSHCV